MRRFPVVGAPPLPEHLTLSVDQQKVNVIFIAKFQGAANFIILCLMITGAEDNG